MEKRKHSVSLSYILLRFGFLMMTCVLACTVIWYAGLSYLESREYVYPGHIGYQQVEDMLEKSPNEFQKPNDDFLPEYVLFNKDNNLITSNVDGKTRMTLLEKGEAKEPGTLQHTYKDGSYIIFRWHFRKEFSNPVWRASLPSFEYLWWATLAISCITCWILNTLWLKSHLVTKLKLFRDVSKKIAAQELDFEIPHAEIKEFDQALGAMDEMRQALYSSLTTEWEAQQQRDSEMAALAHDLKTPITLIGGNAELLLEENLNEEHRKMISTILESNNRAKQYVNSLLETSKGKEETYECVTLDNLFQEVYQNALPLANTKNVSLIINNTLNGDMVMQKYHLIRAIGNVIQNAIEYTSIGGSVTIEGSMTDNGWQIIVCDEGPGFSHSAILHATERLWRGDNARTSTGHNGLGLWFASQVIHHHNGEMIISNGDNGGVVIMKFKENVIPY